MPLAWTAPMTPGLELGHDVDLPERHQPILGKGPVHLAAQTLDVDLLALAHLLKLSPEWSAARIVVRSIARNDEEREFQEKGLATILDEVRIQADADIIKQPQSQSIAQTIHAHSAGASIVFLGMQDPSPGSEAEYAQRLEKLASGLCTTVFVRNAGEFAGRLI